jgi:exopolysaccharide/PEP-CTERM locus tyrosine autokinase
LSTIERAAELLKSAFQAHQKPSSVSEGTANLEQDVIERAAGDISRRRNFSENKDLAGQSRVRDAPARPTGPITRTFKVDRHRLRRQGMITPDGERTAIAESFRRVKRQILANVASPRTGQAPANLVLVTSALPGEGKTFCAINLAISIALEVDRTVLLIDADVARPSLPQALGLQAEKGLMDVLLDRQVDLADALWKTDIGRLSLLPVGATHKHATELLASDAMRGLLQEMAERYHDRIIIFDSPPLLAASEAGVLASQMGQIVVVVESGRTSETALKDALGRIDSSRVAGLLLNKGQGPSLEYGYDGYG